MENINITNSITSVNLVTTQLTSPKALHQNPVYIETSILQDTVNLNWAMKTNLGWLGYIGDYTLYYPVILGIVINHEIRIPINHPVSTAHAFIGARSCAKLKAINAARRVRSRRICDLTTKNGGIRNTYISCMGVFPPPKIAENKVFSDSSHFRYLVKLLVTKRGGGDGVVQL